MSLMDYESQDQPLAPRVVFLRRFARSASFAAFLILGSLAMGIIGYHVTEGLSWLDSLVNAAMILGGMGPVAELRTTGGKLFASFYALYSGLVLLVAAGVLIAPLFHRFLHRFHIEIDSEDNAS
jgi:hypothetical protein